MCWCDTAQTLARLVRRRSAALVHAACCKHRASNVYEQEPLQTAGSGMSEHRLSTYSTPGVVPAPRRMRAGCGRALALRPAAVRTARLLWLRMCMCLPGIASWPCSGGIAAAACKAAQATKRLSVCDPATPWPVRASRSSSTLVQKRSSQRHLCGRCGLLWCRSRRSTCPWACWPSRASRASRALPRWPASPASLECSLPSRPRASSECGPCMRVEHTMLGPPTPEVGLQPVHPRDSHCSMDPTGLQRRSGVAPSTAACCPHFPLFRQVCV